MSQISITKFALRKKKQPSVAEDFCTLLCSEISSEQVCQILFEMSAYCRYYVHYKSKVFTVFTFSEQKSILGIVMCVGFEEELLGCEFC